MFTYKIKEIKKLYSLAHTLLLNVFSALKGTHFYILLVVVSQLNAVPLRFYADMSHIVRKPAFCICENKDADQLRDNREADQRFVFAIRIVQSLFYLNPKFQASCHLVWLYSLVCVRPGQKPRKPVFSE